LLEYYGPQGIFYQLQRLPVIPSLPTPLLFNIVLAFLSVFYIPSEKLLLVGAVAINGSIATQGRVFLASVCAWGCLSPFCALTVYGVYIP